jgi:hypothetical protein
LCVIPPAHCTPDLNDMSRGKGSGFVQLVRLASLSLSGREFRSILNLPSATYLKGEELDPPNRCALEYNVATRVVIFRTKFMQRGDTKLPIPTTAFTAGM